MGGEIVTLPAPMPRHLSVRRALGRFVGGPFDDDDGYAVEVGTYDENDLARIAPFEAVELPIARLFLPRDTARDTRHGETGR